MQVTPYKHPNCPATAIVPLVIEPPVIEPPVTPRTKIIINTIYNDLEKLQSQFGRFEVFGKFQAEHWVTALETYLINQYPSADEICDHFYAFLDPVQFSDWFFGQNSTIWNDLKQGFLTKAREIEFDHQQMVVMKQSDFKNHLLNAAPNDQKLKIEFTNHSLRTYLKEKLKIIFLVYPNIPKSDAVAIALSLMDDNDVAKRFRSRIRKNIDLSALLSYADYEDGKKN